jgi:hypothetical protein
VDCFNVVRTQAQDLVQVILSNMNENLLLQNLNNHATITVEAQPITPEVAERLACHYLALAQLYRSIAGIKPLPTDSHQKRIRQANR